MSLTDIDNLFLNEDFKIFDETKPEILHIEDCEYGTSIFDRNTDIIKMVDPLTLHIKTKPSNSAHESNSADIHCCNVCEKTFKTIESLDAHQASQKYDIPVRCNLCNKQFHSADFGDHRKIHSLYVVSKTENLNASEFLYLCEICNEKFLTKETLQMHVKSKLGDFPISCPFCEGKFHSFDYMHHFKSHTQLFSCEICDESFNNLVSLKTHERKHLGSKPFLCEFCKKSFKEASTLKRHRLKHVTVDNSSILHIEICTELSKSNDFKVNNFMDKSFQCHHCNESFSSVRQFRIHSRNHTKDNSIESQTLEPSFSNSNNSHLKLLKCIGDSDDLDLQHSAAEICFENEIAIDSDRPFCNFNDVQFFNEEIENNNNKADFACNKCGDICCFSKGCVQKTIERLSCEYCQREFHTKNSLSRHIKLHTKGTFQCSECQKTFVKYSVLVRHKNRHKKESFNCSLCNKCFRTLLNLTKHISLVHSSEKKVYICEVCGKSFKTPSGLRFHKIIHTGMKPYLCNLCQKSFNQLRNLKEHELSHSEVKLFNCEDCGKCFKTRRILMQHKAIHNDERPHSCDQCSSSFKHLSSLIGHKATHTGLKPFRCEVCGMAFALAKWLKKHQYVHSEDKPFKCSSCDKAFPQKYKLTQHEKSHKGNT